MTLDSHPSYPHTHSYAADALILAGDSQAALAQITQAFDLVNHLGERICIPELLMLQARCLLGQQRARLHAIERMTHESSVQWSSGAATVQKPQYVRP